MVLYLGSTPVPVSPAAGAACPQDLVSGVENFIFAYAIVKGLELTSTDMEVCN